MMEGSGVEGGETARGKGEVKEQEGFVKEEGEESWGKGQRFKRERKRERRRTEGSGWKRSDK